MSGSFLTSSIIVFSDLLRNGEIKVLLTVFGKSDRFQEHDKMVNVYKISRRDGRNTVGWSQ